MTPESHGVLTALVNSTDRANNRQLIEFSSPEKENLGPVDLVWKAYNK